MLLARVSDPEKRTYWRARHLVSLLVRHDRREVGKKSYNRNALPLYLQAVDRWEQDPAVTEKPLEALARVFTQNANGEFCLSPVRRFAKEIREEKI